ncbi:MAG: hypothetical protein JEY91_14360, partial [Spirochaetaceae bacterium]|nr:hypothetical protein [Spirochaetaceae bacterium]
MIIRLSIRKVILWLIIFTTVLFSLNSEELSNKELNQKIKEAQAYFDEQDYDKAIKILTDVVENSPDRLDQAVDLMDKIIEIRNQYNDKYKELITALYEDEDPARALELIEEMEALEKNPNEASKQAIRNARISAELVYNKIRLREIMDDAKIELDKKEYNNALVLYETGFNLGRQTYTESAIVSDLEKNAVFRSIDEVYRGALSYLIEGEELVSRIGLLQSSIGSTSPEDLDEEIGRLLSLFNNLSAKRDEYLAKSTIIDNNLKVIVDVDKNAPERFFLDFARLLLYGRNDVDFYEGIISSTDLFWEDQFRKLAALLDQPMNNTYDNAIAAYSGGNLDLSSLLFADTLNYSRYSIAIYELLLNRVHISPGFDLNDYSTDLVGEFYGKLVDARVHARVTDTYNTLINLRKSFSDYELSDELPLDELYRLRIQIVGDIPLIDREQKLWDTIGGSINWLEDFNARPETALAVYNLVKDDMSELKSEMKIMNLAILTRLTDQEYTRITAALSGFENLFASNQQLIDGIVDAEVVSYTGDDQLKSTYPHRALPNLVNLQVSLSVLKEDTQEILDTFRNSDIDFDVDSGIEEFLAKTEQIIPLINNLTRSVEELEIIARDNIFQAEGYENQGNKLIETVRGIVRSPNANRENFDRARESLKDANNAYYQSFTFKENIDLRKRVDSDIATLQQELLDGENRLVVADVRNFINQGKEAYVNRQYGRSRVFLERAQNRWLTTNPEEHPEIQYWMALVDLAL